MRLLRIRDFYKKNTKSKCPNFQEWYHLKFGSILNVKYIVFTNFAFRSMSCLTNRIYHFFPFFSRINPYKNHRFNEDDGSLLDKKYVVWYRELFIWIVDIMLNGLFINFILAVFTFQPLHPLVMLADGLTLWLIPKIISYILRPFTDSAKEIVRELPRK